MVSLTNQALNLLQSYLCSRFHRSIINGSFSSWNKVITGVPQGSILGPLLFSIFLSDIFLFISKCQLYNYVDDTTLYKSGKKYAENQKRSGNGFHENDKVLNPGQCHYCSCKISLPHSTSEIIAIKLSSKMPIQLLSTNVDVYFSIFKQCIKQHSRKSLTFDLQ